MFIVPVGKKQIPDPIRGGFLPPEGGRVDEHDIYWQRRIADGDVEVVKEPKK
ncbi:DUF2635 domain-containing protein [Methylotenera oryzisoli]|jgi:hypothetical protein|uniref:DUF2635 domain-containing protein n=1 Tax=Methylotenera oryzisoli TaxID=2080758 RepID=A0A4Y9VS32_9PROT|nr:DUF2635 domain-containing protein [Methylotenera oryzisoli]TFW71401.1 DUF2635 domain-containing protein [Methylotenera oryzisoli]